jgi:hypothetical protein
MKIVAPPQGAHLSTTFGVAYYIEPNGVLENAPPFLASIAVEKGCSVIADNAAPPPPQVTAEERLKKVVAAVNTIVQEGDRKKLLPNGVPRPNEVARIVGFEVTKDEIANAYSVLTEGGPEAEAPATPAANVDQAK